MTRTEPSDQQRRSIEASLDQSFRFEQGASLHAAMLGMVARPSGPHDESPFFKGTCHAGRSHGQLELNQMEPDAAADEPALHIWFDEDRTVVDISPAFAGAPAGALEGSGIPSAVVDGPVVVERSGDAGDGVMALLTQICGGKMVINPFAMLRLIGSDHLTAFSQHQVEDEPSLRAFNATMSLHNLLGELELSNTALINQIAILGYDLRSEAGSEIVALFHEHLHNNAVQLAWFIDEHDRIHTMQAVITLTEFIDAFLTSDAMVEQMAQHESCPVEEMREVVDKYAEAGRLVYVHALWQTVNFADNDLGDGDLRAVAWPEATDLTETMAAQARKLREHAMSNTTAPVSTDATPANITVDADMIATMRSMSGAMHFVLSEVDGDAAAAMQAAQDSLMRVRHLDEPAEPLASFLSDVVETSAGAQFWADISDMHDEPAVLDEVLAAVVAGAAPHVTSARLSGQSPG